MFDRNDRPLKRQYEPPEWRNLPELGRRDRAATRFLPAVLVAIGAFVAALAIAIVAAS